MSWGNVRLGEVTLVKAGGGAPQDTDSFGKSGTSFIRAGSLPKLLSGSDESELEKISDEVAKKHNLKKFPPNVILFAKSGMSATKGHIYKTLNETYVVNHLAILECKGEITPEYLYQVLQLHSPTQLILDPAYPSIRISDIEEFSIPLPPLSEQKRIASILDKADELKRKREAAITKLDQLAQSIFVEMFGERKSNQKNYQKHSLCTITELSTGSTPSRNENGYMGGTINWVKTTEVNGDLITDTEEKLTEAGLKSIRGKLHPVDSIIVAMYGQGKTRGRSAMLAVEAACNQACGVIRPNNSFVSKFMFWQLQIAYQDLRALGRGGNQENLNLNLLGEFEVLLPPSKLQEEFAYRISKLERLKANNIDALAKQNNLFTSLQHQAFAGQL